MVIIHCYNIYILNIHIFNVGKCFIINLVLEEMALLGLWVVYWHFAKQLIAWIATFMCILMMHSAFLYAFTRECLSNSNLGLLFCHKTILGSLMHHIEVQFFSEGHFLLFQTKALTLIRKLFALSVLQPVTTILSLLI